MIQVENLTKHYGTREAIRDVSFNVEKGEILGFLGPNAAGKTTTMRILTGFMPATSGRARVAGFDVFSHSLDVRRRVGYLPETVPLYADMSVASYLNFVAKIKGIDARERQAKFEKALKTCHVEDVAATLMGRLSKGYRQRVGLAQALINDPEVLVLDEPTVGLDPRQISETRQLIKSLSGERTVILSTHILPEVSMICQRVVIINEGRVIAQDTPDNLMTRLRGGDRLEIEVRGPEAEVTKRLQGVAGVERVQRGAEQGSSRYILEVSPGHDPREQVAAAIVQSGFGLLGLRSTAMSLEEIYLKLTTKEEA